MTTMHSVRMNLQSLAPQAPSAPALPLARGAGAPGLPSSPALARSGVGAGFIARHRTTRLLPTDLW